jgi:hypothetical protein
VTTRAPDGMFPLHQCPLQGSQDGARRAIGRGFAGRPSAGSGSEIGVVPCAASQAALLRAEVWASQASCTNSANSCLVISPSRLACTSTELCPSKCGVVKNGVVSSWTRACLSASDSTQKTITSGSLSPVAASSASGRGVRKKTKDLPPTWYTGLPRAPWTTVTCGSPSASSCTSSTRAGRSAVTPGSVGADPVAMQDGGQGVGLAMGNPTHSFGLHAAGRSGLLTRRTRLLNPDAKRMRRRIDLTEHLKSASHAGRRPCDQHRPMASACRADRPTTARPMMLWPQGAYSLVMPRHSRGCRQPTRPPGAPAPRRRARCGVDVRVQPLASRGQTDVRGVVHREGLLAEETGDR